MDYTFVGKSILPNKLSSVVLPHPEVPKIVMNSLSCTLKETPKKFIDNIEPLNAVTPSNPNK